MDFFIENANLILFFPLVMCILLGFNGLVSNKIDNVTMFSLNTVFSFICLLFAIMFVGYAYFQDLIFSTNLQWLALGDINFHFGILLDKVSSLFLLISTITTVVIQMLCYFYLKNSNDYTKSLFTMNLFSLGLNGILISANLFQSYVFCEIVGIASYLLLSIDFANREQSKAGIRTFIFTRIGDLTLLFCVLIVMYFSVIYNELPQANVLSYSSLNNIANSIHSLVNPYFYLFFCAMLIFVVLMKFAQAFAYLSIENRIENKIGKLILIQNILIAIIGIYLFIRVEDFFVLISNWVWLIPMVLIMFLGLGTLNKLFLPLCKTLSWVEKYIVESFTNLIELVFRSLSFLSNRLQGENFQAYITYSLVGLITIFVFVLIFYHSIIKI